MSLRRRVLLSSIAVAVVLLLADVVIASTFRRFLFERVDRQLVTATERYARGPRGPGRQAPPVAAGDFTEYYLGAANPDGTNVRTAAGFLDLGREPPAFRAEEIARHAVRPGAAPDPFTVNGSGDGRWRVAAIRGPNAITLVGIDLADATATMRRMGLVLVVATLAVLGTLLAAAFWVLRQGVRPLVAMTATAGAIADGALSERVAHTDERTEAGRLGEALNTMMGRIETSFDERAAVEARLRRFVADASHELRTPLTSIRGYAELFRTGALGDADKLNDAMRRIEGEASRMGNLVDDLLLLARLDQGRPLAREQVAINAVAADAVADARAVDPDRTIELDSVPATVLGDEARLRQVVGNLVGNALRHTPSTAPVRVRVAHEGAQVRITVADEGPGMSEDVAARVFERFYRADPARHDKAGAGPSSSGLGLSIVHSVVAAHGGDVSLQTAPGAGARFTVTLPTSPATT